MDQPRPSGDRQTRTELLRAARAALGWSYVEASRRAGVSIAAILAAEGKGVRPASTAGVAALRDAYEGAGIVFLDDAGTGFGLRVTAI